MKNEKDVFLQPDLSDIKEQVRKQNYEMLQSALEQVKQKTRQMNEETLQSNIDAERRYKEMMDKVANDAQEFRAKYDEMLDNWMQSILK